MMTLGFYIKRGRQKAELSQARLALLVRAGGPPATQQLVSFWEQDRIVPRADHLEAIALALPKSCKLERLHALAADAETSRRGRAADLRRSA